MSEESKKTAEFVMWAIPILILSYIVVWTVWTEGPKYVPRLSSFHTRLSSFHRRIKASLMQYTIKQKFPLLLKIAGVGAFLLFIWPTPYDYIRDTRIRAELWRVNRFTGLKQQATKTGWRSEAEISDEYNRAKKKEQDIKEGEVALLAKRKEYPATTFGSNNEYQIKLSTAYIDAELVWEAEISPYNGALEDYCRTWSRTDAVEIVLLNEQGFKFRRLRADDSSRIWDGKGGSTALELTGKTLMSSSDYKAIKSFTPRWRF
jgi:hypothetical protein